MGRKRRGRAAPSELSGIFGGTAAQQPAHSPDPAQRRFRRGVHGSGSPRDAPGSGPARHQAPHPPATPPASATQQRELPTPGSAVSSVAGAVESAGTAFFSPPRSSTRRAAPGAGSDGPASPSARPPATAAASSASPAGKKPLSHSHAAKYSAATSARRQGRPAFPSSPRAALTPVLNVPGPAGLREFVRLLHQAQQLDASVRGSFTARVTPPTLAYLARCILAAAAAAPPAHFPSSPSRQGGDHEAGSPARLTAAQGKHWSPLRPGPPQHDYGPWLRAGLVAHDTPAVVLRQLRVESIRLWMLRGSLHRIAVVARDTDAGDTAHSATAQPRVQDLLAFTGLTHLDLAGVDPALLHGLLPLRQALLHLTVSRRRISAEELSRLLGTGAPTQEVHQNGVASGGEAGTGGDPGGTRDGEGSHSGPVAASAGRGPAEAPGLRNGDAPGAADSPSTPAAAASGRAVRGEARPWRGERGEEEETSSSPHSWRQQPADSLRTTVEMEDEDEDEVASDSYYSNDEASVRARSSGVVERDDSDSYYSKGGEAGAQGAVAGERAGGDSDSDSDSGSGSGSEAASASDGSAGEAGGRAGKGMPSAPQPATLRAPVGGVSHAEEPLPWSSLTALSLTHLSLDRMPGGLRLMPRLRALDLSYNRLTEVPYVASCPSLARLNLSFNRIDGAALADERVGNVETLLLRGNCITSSRGVHRLYGLKVWPRAPAPTVPRCPAPWHALLSP